MFNKSHNYSFYLNRKLKELQNIIQQLSKGLFFTQEKVAVF